MIIESKTETQSNLDTKDQEKTMNLLLLETLPDGFYCATPIVERKPDYDSSFILVDEWEQSDFVFHYHRNPTATVFAYSACCNYGAQEETHPNLAYYDMTGGDDERA